MQVVFGSVVGLALTVVVAGLVTFLGVLLFERTTRDIDEWQELRQGNLAVGVVIGATVVAVGLIVRPALQHPFIAADLGWTRPFYELLINALGVFVALGLAVLAIGFAVWLFTRLTANLDEWAELQAGNQAVALLMAGVILAVALLTETAVERIVNALIDLLF